MSRKSKGRRNKSHNWAMRIQLSQDRAQWFQGLCEASGIQFESYNSGRHLRGVGELGTVDFWPGSGRHWVHGTAGAVRNPDGLESAIRSIRGPGNDQEHFRSIMREDA